MHAGRATRFRSRSVSTSTTSPYPRCSPRGQPHQPSQQQSPGVASAASVHCDDGRSGGCVDAADAADSASSSSSAATSASSCSSSNLAALSGGGGGQQPAVGFCPAVGGMAETASPLLPVGELAAEGVGEGDRGDGTAATATATNAGADDAGADATPDGSVAMPRQSVHANVAAGAGAGSERAAREHTGLRPPAAAGAAQLSVCEPAVRVRAGDDDQLCRIVSDVVRRRQQQQKQKQQQQMQKHQPAQLQQPSQQVTPPLKQSPPAAEPASKVPSVPPPGDEPDFGADNAAVVAQSVLSLFREMHRTRRPCPQQRSRRQTGGGGGGGGLRRVGGAMTVGRRLGRTLRAVALGYGIRSLLVGAGALTALGGYALGGPHLLAATLYAVSHFADPTAVAAIV